MKKFAVGIGVLTVLLPFAACNSSEEITTVLPTGAVVRTFSLSANDSVMAHLDSVYFSIDLYSGDIFNADSLPYGTRTSGLTPVITTDGASVAELYVPRVNGVDTVINYLENTTDTINFSNGPVRLRLVSLDGLTERNYRIKVNVHQVPTDSLVWDRSQQGGSLPSAFGVVNAQHTTQSPDGRFYCLTEYDGRYCIATADNPAGTWEKTIVQFGFKPDINSFTATTDGLYILDTSSALYKADKPTANGAASYSWVATGTKMTNIVGAYDNRLFGTLRGATAMQWSLVEYPSQTVGELPEGFPVSGFSTPVRYKFEMSASKQMLLCGGRKSDGELTADSWGFDGNTWTCLTMTPMPRHLENLTLVPYYNVQPDSTAWRVSQKTSVVLAMCGNTADGVPNDTVYMSRDFGMHWTKAPAKMQTMRGTMPSRTQAQAFLYTAQYGVAKSRATAPITSWDVPVIYLFGGRNEAGTTYNTLFRGLITSLSFKPLQ